MKKFLSTAAVSTVLAAASAAQTATQVVNTDAAGIPGLYGTLPTFFIPQTGGISADGRYVAFSSNQLLDAGDTNGKLDIFVKDLWSGAIARVSVASDGTLGNDGNSPAGGAAPTSVTASPAISANGRFVVFQSTFNNLVVGDTNAAMDVFLHDRDADENGTFDETGPGARKTVRCSVSAAGAQGTGATASPATNASVSDDGRHVCFQSTFTNLVPGDTNGQQDVFVYVRDLTGGSLADADLPGNIAVVRMSVKPDGTQSSTINGNAINASISGDGRHVTFVSMFSDLVIPDANNLQPDVFVRDRDADADGIFDETGPGEQTLSLVSVKDDGSQPVFNEGSTSIAPQQAISADGRYIVFGSFADLVTSDLDGTGNIFLRDRDGDGDGVFDEGLAGLDNTYAMDFGANDGAQGATVSPNGRFVSFRSFATNLVPGDTNFASDHFVVDRAVGSLTRVSVDSASGQQEGVSNPASLTGSNGGFSDVANDGVTAFRSSSNNLSPANILGVQDIFTNGPYPRTQAVSAPAIGATTNVSFKAPFHAGMPYLAAVSGGWTPGIFLSNGAILPMNDDELFALSATTPLPFLLGFAGTLDASGEATGGVDIPNVPALVGLSLTTSFVVIDLSRPTLVGAMSNAVVMTFAPAGP